MKRKKERETGRQGRREVKRTVRSGRRTHKTQSKGSQRDREGFHKKECDIEAGDGQREVVRDVVDLRVVLQYPLVRLAVVGQEVLQVGQAEHAGAAEERGRERERERGRVKRR
jgi:hypothetical protein